jgi:hypothetical protein
MKRELKNLIKTIEISFIVIDNKLNIIIFINLLIKKIKKIIKNNN